jgi:hypothetical protein
MAGSIVAMNFVMSSQAAWLEAVERRISATSAMLASMKGIKMSGLKQTLFDNLQKLRAEELHISKRFRKLMIWTMAFCKYTFFVFYYLCQCAEQLTSLCHASLCSNLHFCNFHRHRKKERKPCHS